MPFETFKGFGQPEQKTNNAEIKSKPHEVLKGFRKKLWEKTRHLLISLGMDIPSQESSGTEDEIVDKILDIRNNCDDDKFLDAEIKLNDEDYNLRTIAQIDQEFNPDRKKNYDDWDLTAEEEAVRWLNREILVNEKLQKFTRGDTFSADELAKANRDPKAGTMYLLKKTKEQDKEQEQYGKEEGRLLAKTLLDMQSNLGATEMIKEIMAENGIKTKLEMEQKIFEDYFDNFQGYMDNSKEILKHLADKKLAKSINGRMKKFESIIKGCQMEENEYSFVHGDLNFNNIIYSGDKAYLSDWQKAGKTQNKELSLIYDLGNVLQESVEKFDNIEQTKEFISGIEEEITEHYSDHPEVAEAIIILTKLRSFAMMVNDLEDDEKRDYVMKELGDQEL
jgi:thiamine kinase-like enzyme